MTKEQMQPYRETQLVRAGCDYHGAKVELADLQRLNREREIRLALMLLKLDRQAAKEVD